MTANAVDLAVFGSAVHSVAEEMGAALRRAAYSPNIKERRDYSCAVFDAKGQAIAMGDHMPVHLGSMPMSVQSAIVSLSFHPGDVAVLNDPFAGGTHLPDITMVMPVFGAGDQPLFYVAARAHHADVGGRYPGSMGLCSEIYQEGLRIPPMKLMRGGVIDGELLALVLANVRTPVEREGDLTAQLGACRLGAARVGEILAKFSEASTVLLAAELLDYSERLMKAELSRMPEGLYAAEDFLDSDGVSDNPVRLQVSVQLLPDLQHAVVDFAGTDAQVASSINAVYAITASAVYYVMRCLLGTDAPATSGILRPVTVIAPEGTVVNARPPAPVAGGNVEMSQRIVDVVLRAMAKAVPHRIPAASAGTMNNLTIGGLQGRGGAPFAYYETIAGGMGAGPAADGLPGVHTHMTNSLNTPAEALEYAYPLRVLRYEYRKGSGGSGMFRGGDGLVREIKLLADSQVTLLADRRRIGPYGLSGGSAGQAGRTVLRSAGEERNLPGKCSVTAKAGDVIRIESPGGGGWGSLEGDPTG